MIRQTTYADTIRAARRRRVVLPSEFYSGRNARNHAFTVSNLAGLSQVQAVLDSLIADLERGGNFNAWRDGVMKDGRFGKLTAAQLETIYRTNLQTHYAQGLAESIRRNAATHPFLQYSAIRDTRTRPHHAALHGTILPIDHAFWKTHFPPLGFNCRCTVIALTRRQAARKIEEAREAGKTIDRSPVGNFTDPGWNYDRLNGTAAEGLARAARRRQDVCSVVPAAQVHCITTAGAQSLQAALQAAERGEDLAALVQDIVGDKWPALLAMSSAATLLSDSERVALAAILGEFGEQVDQLLRYTAGEAVDAPEWLGPLVLAADRGLERLPAHSDRIAFDLPTDRRYRVGDVIRIAGYVLAKPTGRFVVVDHTGRDMSAFGATALLPRGTEFRVIDASSDMIQVRMI